MVYRKLKYCWLSNSIEFLIINDGKKIIILKLMIDGFYIFFLLIENGSELDEDFLVGLLLVI